MATFVHKMSFIMLPLQKSKRSSALSLTWFQYKQLKGGWSGWIGSMIRSRMKCRLMDMKEKMWCNTERNSLPDGRTMKKGWSHMTRMATSISSQLDFLFCRATTFDLFLSLIMSPHSMPMTEERLSTTTPVKKQLFKKRVKVLPWWYLTC